MPQRGFTLIELMIVLVIAALLMLLAAPAFSTFMARQQLAGDVNQMQSVLTFARSEAIKQRQPITVEFSPPNELNAARRPDACNDAPWCYWAESAQGDGEANVMRVGQTDNITQPEGSFSLVFESLGDADISDCDDVDGQCEITLSEDNLDPVTLTVRVTGSLHKEAAQ
ncbi:GspH/FimT family pseudopilin [Halomonas sp. 18H]|jgi:type IV fimbrial biogenesis protein FimT|uniref:GspH/FimT family pseudopilin n=1 Tax=Halomonas sp. CSM-2 TaxID=1975722 RepID=UPI000A28345F|nr:MULTISPECIES: GspH/FimT family pseudopilin [unclassified Halomonas]MCW4150600.1 GspH/FimT family pseudopilin [Halomonas sp. 18H]